MEKYMEKGKFYILEKNNPPHVFNGFISLELEDKERQKIAYEDALSKSYKKVIKYEKKKDEGYYVKHVSFAHFLLLEEPMLFNHERLEYFTKIPIQHISYDIGTFDFSRKQQQNMPEGKIKSCDSITIYPFTYRENWTELNGLHSCFEEISGTELYNLLYKIKDPNSSMENPTFKRHIQILNSLFETACQKANLPYRTVTEYHNYIARESLLKSQNATRIKIKDENDDAQAKLILDRFSKKY